MMQRSVPVRRTTITFLKITRKEKIKRNIRKGEIRKKTRKDKKINAQKKILEKRPDMPIIICSGFNKKINSEIVREMGVRKYLEKPIEMKTFARSIRNVLDGN